MSSDQPGGENDGAPRGIDEAQGAARQNKGLPPVHLWNPPFGGHSDMVIHRDGTWDYRGSPIRRPAMVRLFSTILRRDDDGRYYLVTPAEKLEITVEDAPFLAVDLRVSGAGAAQTVTLITNVGDEVDLGPDNPMRVEIDPASGEPAPYIHVRANLDALISRAVFYDLVELGVEQDIDGTVYLGVWSGGLFFPFGPAPES